MEVDLALLADAATIDGSGKLNILGSLRPPGDRGFPRLDIRRLALVLRFTAGVHEVGQHRGGDRAEGSRTAARWSGSTER